MQIPLKYQHLVKEISDERQYGDGYFIYLSKPYCNIEDEPLGGLHTIHEWTVKECLDKLKHVKVCPCESCQNHIKQNK